MTKEGPIRTDTILGDVLKDYPGLRDRIRELFGADCLSCRSNQKETITYTSWHRGLNPGAVVRELNGLLRRKE